MATPTTYTFSIENDFPNHKVASDRLTQEIQTSAIVTVLDCISTAGDDCNIVFKDALSPTDESLLDGIVAVHSGEPLPSESQPVEVTNKPETLPNLFPPGVDYYMTGCGDDIANNKRGEGVQFEIASTTTETKTLESQYLDYVLPIGGCVRWSGAGPGCWATMEVVCPATGVTPNVGNTGNCNVVGGVIVPAAGDGAYDVDLSAAVPVPAESSDGYWDCTTPDTGRGVITPSANPGYAAYHLLAVEVMASRYINRLPLVPAEGDEDIVVTMTTPAVVRAEWKLRASIYNNGQATLYVGWNMVCGRHTTV